MSASKVEGQRAFDNNLDDERGWISDDDAQDEWLQFEFPYEKIISMYRIWSRYDDRTANSDGTTNTNNRKKFERPPKTWKLLGTNDSTIASETTTTVSNWTELDDISSVSYTHLTLPTNREV